MKLSLATAALVLAISPMSPLLAQPELETLLCEAAETGAVIEIVYDEDVYLHGWQTRGCTKGRDYESERIFRFDKIQSVKLIEGEFGERSQSVKDEGWDGCIGSNCFIDENICE